MGTNCVGASEISAADFCAGAGAAAAGAAGSGDPSGRVTASMLRAEAGADKTLEVGGLIALGGMGAPAGLAGMALAAPAAGFGGREIRMVSFLILPAVTFNAGLGRGVVGEAIGTGLGGTAEAGGAAGAAEAAGVLGAAAARAAAAMPDEIAMVCLGKDMPAGMSGFCVIRLGGVAGSLAPGGKFGWGGGGGGRAILPLTMREQKAPVNHLKLLL